jgi:hypothetical protein
LIQLLLIQHKSLKLLKAKKRNNLNSRIHSRLRKGKGKMNNLIRSQKNLSNQRIKRIKRVIIRVNRRRGIIRSSKRNKLKKTNHSI